ncbi:unnamed protein product, partial [Oikopleura dioica]
NSLKRTTSSQQTHSRNSKRARLS